MNRAVSGVLYTRSTGRPIVGARLVAARLEKNAIMILGIGLSGDYGRFRIVYPELRKPADLTLFIFSASGDLIYREPVHRAVSGAELALHIEIPHR